MKYMICILFLIQVVGIAAMSPESKAKKLQSLQRMNEPKVLQGMASKEANRALRALPPEGSVEEDRRLVLDYVDRKLREQDQRVEEVLSSVQDDTDFKIIKIAALIDNQMNHFERQMKIVVDLSRQIRDLFQKGREVRMQVMDHEQTIVDHEQAIMNHEQTIDEMKQGTNTQFYGLADVADAQIDMTLRQNNVIKYLIAKLSKQRKKLKEQADLLAKTNTMVKGLTKTCNDRELNGLITFFEKEMARERNIAVDSDGSGSEIYREVLGDNYEQVLHGNAKPVFKAIASDDGEEGETVSVDDDEEAEVEGESVLLKEPQRGSDLLEEQALSDSLSDDPGDH